jgi:hypothetical protein
MDGSSMGGPNAGNGLKRAEIFEDEKRRIIESCFVKQDNDGSREDPSTASPLVDPLRR